MRRPKHPLITPVSFSDAREKILQYLGPVSTEISTVKSLFARCDARKMGILAFLSKGSAVEVCFYECILIFLLVPRS